MAKSIRTDIENNGKVDNLSRPLLRTNPKLTTNVKLVIANDGLFLESFNADPKLAGAAYKKFRVKPKGDYSYDVAKFWNSSKTPVDLLYKVKRDFSDFSILDTYDKQIEETYSYGTSTNYSKLYSEDIKILAPIWLDKNIPGKFLIYRINEAKPSLNYENTNSLERINEDLSNATLIKTFDLTKDSDIGKYLRNHVENENFPTSPIKMSFERSEKTIYNGIDLIKGGFTSKGEFQYNDTVKVDKPLIEYNDFVTDGFFRNNTACANLINLEFMFNDDESEEFTVNRYFGIFVDEHRVGSGNVTRISGDKLIFSNIEHEFDNLSQDWMSLPFSKFFKEKPILGWVKSSEKYHNVKNGRSWIEEQYETKIDLNNSEPGKFLDKILNGSTIDATPNPNHEPDYLKIEVTDVPNNNASVVIANLKKQRFTIQVVEVGTTGAANQITDDGGVVLSWTSQNTEEATLDEIVNQWPTTGTFAKYSPYVNERNGKWVLEAIENEVNMEQSHTFTESNAGNNLIKIKHTVKPVEVNASTFFADNTLQRGRVDGKRFSNQGDLKNIAFALSEVIRLNTRFDVLLKDAIIYLKSPINGFDRCIAGFFTEVSNNPFIDFGDSADTQNSLEISSAFLSQYNSYKFNGGSNANQSLYIPADEADEFNVGDYLLDIKNRFNKIIYIAEDARTINTEFKKIILERKNDGLSGVLGIYEDFRTTWGYFDAYDIYDLNFDFYDDSNSNIKELYYESLEEDPATGANTYGYWYPGANTAPKQAYNDMESLETKEIEYFANLVPLLKNERQDLVYDIGNLPLGAAPTLLSKKRREIISSEFDRLEENNTTQFSTVSRVVPFINKWCLKDSTNVRQNPYYMNVSEVFGDTNFSPDFNKEEREPLAMTHEWFYMDKLPGYFTDKSRLNSVFSYVNPSKDCQIDLNDFYSIDHDYFKSYFLSYGLESNHPSKAQWGDTDLIKKYSFLTGGDKQKFSETIFNGMKFTFKNRKKQIKEVTKEFVPSSDFNNYRFSTVLRTKFDPNFSNEVNLTVVQNKKFKYVVFYIELILSDDNFSWLNRKILYELDHKLQYDPSTGDSTYADIPLSGALDLDNVSLPSSAAGFTIINGVTHANGTTPLYTSQLLKDPESGDFGIISAIIAGTEYYLQVSNVINDSTFEVRGGLLNPFTGGYQSPSAFTLNEILTANYSYSGGGVFAHSSLLNRLCIRNISERVNLTDKVDYVTVENDGTLKNDKFVMRIDNGVEVIKQAALTVNVDTEKPKAFGLSNMVIGYTISEREESYFSMMNRHNGEYTVDMRPVITFRELFSCQKLEPDSGWGGVYQTPTDSFDYNNPIEEEIATAIYKKLNYCRTQFNLGRVFEDPYCPSDSKWGIIKNHFFHKVNEIDTEGVIRLSELDSLPPKYNLIGEIAIDKKDKNVFKSRWEDNFYIRSGGGGSKKPVPGTKNIIEEKNYVASSILKINEFYDIYNFTSKKYRDLEELNDIRQFGTPEVEVSFSEAENIVTMDFDLASSIVRELDFIGVRNTLEKYVIAENSFGNVDTLDDDVEFYIRENILRLFTIKNINLYVKTSKQIPAGAPPKFGGLVRKVRENKERSYIDSVTSVGSVTDDGYMIDNSFTYKIDPKNPLNFRLIYNKNKGMNYKFRPLIKIQS